MKSLTLNLILLLIMVFSTALTAQNRIEGSITETANNVPVIGANILLLETMEGTVTNQDGNFNLTSEQSFPWTIEVSYTGFVQQTIQIDSPKETLTIQLEEGISFGQDVIISASRRAEKITETPSSVSVLTSEKLGLLAVPAGDPVNLLKNIQGVTIVPHGINKSLTTLRGRATSLGTRALFMKDYRTLNDFYSYNYDNERVPVLPIDMIRLNILV